MRKYLEQEMLAESLRGYVRYQCTAYPGMDGCHIFEVYFGNEIVKRFSLETVNTYFINHNLKEKDTCEGISEYWDGFMELLDKVPLHSRSEYTDDEFCDALKNYRNHQIKDSLASENPIENMFAILDRRIGSRTLASL